MRDRDAMTAHEAASEAIDALKLRVKWLTEEVVDLRESGDRLQAKADQYMSEASSADMAGRIALVNGLVAALNDWSEVRETYDCD